MNLFQWVMSPINRLKAMRAERLELHHKEMVQLADLHAGIEDGTVSGDSLDAVTECLESMSIKPAKVGTDKIVKKDS